jgi:hypothetical protein
VLSHQQIRPATFASNPEGSNMAEADLDIVIRSIAKKQHKILMDAAKKQHGRLMGLAAKAKTREIKARYKQTARTTLLLAGAAARRLQVTAENAADSYARAMKKAAEENKAAEAKPAKKAAAQKPVKKPKN